MGNNGSAERAHGQHATMPPRSKHHLPVDPDIDLSNLFHVLDAEHRGFLTLKELIRASDDWPLPHSIPALFFFDHEKNGTLSCAELGEIVGACREEKRCALQNLDSNPKFRELIKQASAAGVSDCSQHNITSFRKVSNNCNIRRHYSRVPSANASPQTSHNGSAGYLSDQCDNSSVGSYESHGIEEQTHGHMHRSPDAPKPPALARIASEAGGDSGFSSDDEAEEDDCVTDNAPIARDELERHQDNCGVTVLVPDCLSPNPAASKSSSPCHNKPGPISSRTVAMYCSQREFEDLKEAGEIRHAVNSHGRKVPVLEAGSTTAVDAAVVEKVNKDFLRKMAGQLLTNDGTRELFMQWLWKLTDFSRSGAVSTDDLALLLQVLEEDGINVEELVFNQDITVPLKQRIMDEFDTSHSGIMTRDAFMVFADLVTREYEFWENRHLDTIGDYELGRSLGNGSSGIVRSAFHVESKQTFAAKIIKKGNCSDLSRLDREIQSLKIMSDHEAVVDLVEVLETEDNLVLILELCGGGSLVDITRLYPDEKMPEDVARHFMHQMFDAVASCHANGVCHRDVRLDNMLLSNSGVLKVTDFGHSGIFSPEWDIFQTSLVGSIYNLSPEQVAGQCYSGEKIDVWSAGIVLYSLLVGRPPFFDADTVALLQSITTGTFELPGFLSDDAQDLIRSMIRVRREDRPCLRECLQHPWFKGGPRTPPVMDVVHIPVDNFFKKRPDLAEMIFAGTVHEYRLHFHLAEEEEDEKAGMDWCLKCHCPNMGIKFSIGLVTKPAPSEERDSLNPGRIGLATPTKLTWGGKSEPVSIIVEQTDAMVDESGYDEDDEEDAPTDSHVTKGRHDEPFTEIRKQIAEFPAKRIPPALPMSSSPRQEAVKVPQDAQIPEMGSLSLSDGGKSESPTSSATPPLRALTQKSSCSDIRSKACRFQPFVQVNLREGDAGLFLKVCRNLKLICDTKLADAAHSYRSSFGGRFEGRKSGGMRRNVSDIFVQTGSESSPSTTLRKPPPGPSPLYKPQ